MSPPPEYLRLPFEEAIAYMALKLALPTESIKKLTAEYHNFTFVVSGLTRAELVEDVKFLVDEAIAKGTDLETFKKQFNRLIGRKGWNPGESRQKLIMETNVRRAYSAGRHQQMSNPGLIKRRPYRQWRHGDSVVPRPNHLALHNKVFDATDPFWDVVGAGCVGFGCKCKVFSLSGRDLKRMGLTVSKPPDPYTIAEQGFQRAPGTVPQRDRADILKDGLARLSPELQNKVKADLQNRGILILEEEEDEEEEEDWEEE